MEKHGLFFLSQIGHQTSGILPVSLIFPIGSRPGVPNEIRVYRIFHSPSRQVWQENRPRKESEGLSQKILPENQNKLFKISSMPKPSASAL